MTRMLASVTSIEEARIALDAGADIIDLKNPLQGALGALPVETVRSVVQVVAGRCLTSATIGDLPMQPELIAQAVVQMAATGVDIVKIGLFGEVGHQACIHAISPLTRKQKVVAVLFADAVPELSILPLLADAGLYGVMLDTAQKSGKRLTDFLELEVLARFIDETRSLGLFSGLAGSLRAEDIPLLLPLVPDYLGFRGALCESSNRINALSQTRTTYIVQLLQAHHIMDNKVMDCVA